MDKQSIFNKAKARLEMLDVQPKADLLSYSVEKAGHEAADYCNLSSVEYFPPDAEFWLAEYAAAEYAMENEIYKPLWGKMIKDAEIRLLAYRRMRW